MQQFEYPDNFFGDLMRSSDAQDKRIGESFDSYGLVGAAGQLGQEAFKYPAEVATGAAKNYYDTMKTGLHNTGQFLFGKKLVPDPKPVQPQQPAPGLGIKKKQFSREDAINFLKNKALQKPKSQPVNLGLPGVKPQPQEQQPIDAGLRSIISGLAYQPAPPAPAQIPEHLRNRGNIMDMETGFNANALPGGAFGGIMGLNLALASMLPEYAARKAEDKAYAAQQDETNIARQNYDKDRQYQLGLASLLSNIEMNRQKLLHPPEAGAQYMPVTLTDTALDGTRVQKIVPFDKRTGKVIKSPEEQQLERKIKIAQSVLENPDKHPGERVLKAQDWLNSVMQQRV